MAIEFTQLEQAASSTAFRQVLQQKLQGFAEQQNAAATSVPQKPSEALVQEQDTKLKPADSESLISESPLINEIVITQSDPKLILSDENIDGRVDLKDLITRYQSDIKDDFPPKPVAVA